MATEVTSTPPNPRRNPRHGESPRAPGKSIVRRDSALVTLLAIALFVNILLTAGSGFQAFMSWGAVQEIEAEIQQVRQINEDFAATRAQLKRAEEERLRVHGERRPDDQRRRKAE